MMFLTGLIVFAISVFFLITIFGGSVALAIPLTVLIVVAVIGLVLMFKGMD